MQANSSETLILEINYLLPGIIQTIHRISLCHNRTITLYINIIGIPNQIDFILPSKYTTRYDLYFNDVFLGEKEPMAKV